MNEVKFTKPVLRYDDQGHAIPFTDAERLAQLEAFRVALEEMKAIVEDPFEVKC